VIIATENATIGMGGPVMIEGGGLGVYAPEEVGPLSMQAPNGVIDMLVADEAKAVFAAKQYLSYFQGITPKWTCADQRLLRHLIPENRLRAYNIRKVIETLADEGSVLELRRQFGRGNSHETYQRGKALNIASLEIDDVIDPLETHRWLMQGLRSIPKSHPKEGKRRPFVDCW